MSSNNNVAVVGGGIVGLAIADALCRAGADVTVIERGAIAGGTTGNTFSWLNATSKTGDESYHRLNAAGVDAWRKLAGDVGEDTIGFHPSGMIEWVGGADENALADLDGRRQRLAGWGYPARRLNRAELAALEPHFAFPPQAVGLHAFGDAWLDASRAASFLAERIRKNHGRIVEGCAARGIGRENGDVAAVETDGPAVPARRVVIAAGPDTARVLADLSSNQAFASRTPVDAVPGALIQTPPTAPWRWVHGIVYCEVHGSLHIRPAPGGGLLLGGDDTDDQIANGHDERALDRIERTLLDRARKLIPALPVDAWIGRCTRRVGVRPMPRDGHSIVGELPGEKGIFVAATHSGVTLAPAIGNSLAETVLTGKAPALIAPFGYDRFQRPG